MTAEKSGLSRREFLGAGLAAMVLGAKERRARAQSPDGFRLEPMSDDEIRKTVEDHYVSTNKQLKIVPAESVPRDLHDLMAALTIFKLQPQTFNRPMLWELLKSRLPGLGSFSEQSLLPTILHKLPEYFAKRGIIAKIHLGKLSLPDNGKIQSFYPEIDFFRAESVRSSAINFDGRQIPCDVVYATEYLFGGRSHLTLPIKAIDGTPDSSPAEVFFQNIFIYKKNLEDIERSNAAEAEREAGERSITEQQLLESITLSSGEQQLKQSINAARIRLRRKFGSRPPRNLEYFIAHEKGHVLDTNNKLNNTAAIKSEVDAIVSSVKEKQGTTPFHIEAYGEIWGALGGILFFDNKAAGLYDLTLYCSDDQEENNAHQRAFEFVLFSIIKELYESPDLYGVRIEEGSPLSAASQVLWQLPNLCSNPQIIDLAARRLWYKFRDPAFTTAIVKELGLAFDRSTISKQPITELRDRTQRNTVSRWSLWAALAGLGTAALARLARRKKRVAEAEALGREKRKRKKKKNLRQSKN